MAFVTLKRHVDSVHLKLKPFKCQHCVLEFAQRWLLNRHHKRVHLKLKPWPCPGCGMSFAEKSDMKPHISKHHPELIEHDVL